MSRIVWPSTRIHPSWRNVSILQATPFSPKDEYARRILPVKAPRCAITKMPADKYVYKRDPPTAIESFKVTRFIRMKLGMTRRQPTVACRRSMSSRNVVGSS